MKKILAGAALASMLFSPLASAAYPNVAGSYSWTATITLSNCTYQTGPSTGLAGDLNGLSIPSSGTQSFTQVDSTITSQGGTESYFLPTGWEIDVDGTYLSSGEVASVTGGDTFIVDTSGNITEPADPTFSGFYSNGTITFSSSANDNFFRFSDGSEYECDTPESGTASKNGSVVTEATPSTNVTQTTSTLVSTVTTMINSMTTRINNVLKGSLGGFRLLGNKSVMFDNNMGRAAGDSLEGVGAWGSYSYMDFENDSVGAAYDGDRQGIMAGMDFKPADNMVVGVSLGFETTDIDTAFNSGGVDSDGYTIAPYFGMLIDDHWSFDSLAGYTAVDTDQSRTTAGSRVTSGTDSDRWFASANLTYAVPFSDTFYIEGRGGIMSANEEQDGYIESDGTVRASTRVAVTQLSLGGSVSYLGYENMFPYVGLTYNYDASRNDAALVGAGGSVINDDDDDLLGNLGFRYENDNNVSAGLEWSHRFDRANFEEDTLNVDVRIHW